VFDTADGTPPDRWNAYHLTATGRSILTRPEPDTVDWPIDGRVILIRARQAAPFTAEIAPDADLVVVRLFRCGTISVRFLGEDGRLIVNQPYRIEPVAATPLHEWLRRRRTQRGSDLVVVPVGRFRITATLDGIGDVERELQVGEDEEVEAELP